MFLNSKTYESSYKIFLFIKNKKNTISEKFKGQRMHRPKIYTKTNRGKIQKLYIINVNEENRNRIYPIR